VVYSKIFKISNAKDGKSNRFVFKFLLAVLFVCIVSLFDNSLEVNASTVTAGNFSSEVMNTMSTYCNDFWSSGEYFWIGLHLSKDNNIYRMYCFKNINTNVYLTDNSGYHYSFSNNDFVYCGEVTIFDNGEVWRSELLNGTYYDNDYILEHNKWCIEGISKFYSSATQCSDSVQGILFKNINVYSDETLSNMVVKAQDSDGKLALNLRVSTTQKTTEPVEISTQFFDKFTFQDIESYEYCEEGKEYQSLHVKTLYNTKMEQLTYAFYCNVTHNRYISI